MSERLEFDLHQGWSRGLRLAFEDLEGSKAFNLKTALHVDQVHGDEILQLGASDFLKVSPLAKADGMYLQGDDFKNCKRPLLIKTADCLPLFMVDRETQALAALHAGWRGLAKGIHKKLFLQGKLQPKTTWVWAGPSMSGAGFFVREDMWSQFPSKISENPKYFEKTQDSAQRIFHAWELLNDDLKDLGVELVYNVEVNTFEDKAFNSYRRNGAGYGLNYSWARFYL